MLRETTSRGQCEVVCASRTGTREEPGTFTRGGALFSLVPLVWESNPKLQGGWCKPNHQPIGGSDQIPTIRGSVGVDPVMPTGANKNIGNTSKRKYR